MYNEEAHELAVTLRSICKNVQYMGKKLARPDFWRDVAVCIVCDGREKASDSATKLAQSLRLIDSSMMKNAASENPGMGAHLFESVATFKDDEVKGTEFPPLQISFVV
jgi:hypothetical protein